MALKEVCEKCEKFYEKAKGNPKLWIGIGILLAIVLLIWLPPWRVSHFEINNATVEADLENQYRATIAQIIGGFAILLGLYFTWGNLLTAKEGQITERFTKAVDQLGATDKDGNPAIEIRLGGIYALERISKESDKDYWPIMEILTAYVRRNSSIKLADRDNSHLDTQAIIAIIRRRKYSFYNGEPNHLDLQRTYIINANFREANLQGADFQYTILTGANFIMANLRASYLQNAVLEIANLYNADIKWANLEFSNLEFANLYNADLKEVKLMGANLKMADLEFADLYNADLKEANLTETRLNGAKNLTVEQLSKAKTLYKAQLDPELENELRTKGFGHLLDDEPDK